MFPCKAKTHFHLIIKQEHLFIYITCATIYNNSKSRNKFLSSYTKKTNKRTILFPYFMLFENNCNKMYLKMKSLKPSLRCLLSIKLLGVGVVVVIGTGLPTTTVKNYKTITRRIKTVVFWRRGTFYFIWCSLKHKNAVIK